MRRKTRDKRTPTLVIAVLQLYIHTNTHFSRRRTTDKQGTINRDFYATGDRQTLFRFTNRMFFIQRAVVVVVVFVIVFVVSLEVCTSVVTC